MKKRHSVIAAVALGLATSAMVTQALAAGATDHPFGHLVRELRSDLLEQRFDVGHVAVDRAARHARGGGELADVDLGDAAFGEQLHRCGVDALARRVQRQKLGDG